ncbi:hypothetical protein PIB30_039707 [Stylosanthes scabra]|uniref:Uncharacterized protein n=1 Tax=Stylosanthes scabra TaxID=79078 RepID=A0ABU6YBS6_9FABA|nr:hypothetical protein [Stylosanthes scabra]
MSNDIASAFAHQERKKPLLHQRPIADPTHHPASQRKQIENKKGEIRSTMAPTMVPSAVALSSSLSSPYFPLFFRASLSLAPSSLSLSSLLKFPVCDLDIETVNHLL